MAGWLVVLLVAAAVAVPSAVALLVVSAIGSVRKLSTGPVVVAARVLFVVLLVAIVVCLGAGLWGGVAGALATLS
jgi:hypothetical protein